MTRAHGDKSNHGGLRSAFCRSLKAGLRWRYRRLVGSLRRLTGKAGEEADARRYLLADGRYDAKSYWSDRHTRHRHSFRGVGNKSRSEEENIRGYSAAVDTIVDLLRSISFDPHAKAALDIGCGNGFWTGILQEFGVARYTGVDIADTMFDLLRTRHLACEFKSGAFGSLPLKPGFDLVIMIDVTQHVTDDAELVGMLERVRALLARDGVFIVTFWNQQRPQESFYEKFRPFSFYTTALTGLAHTDPVPFRDKFVAAFYNPERRVDAAAPQRLRGDAVAAVIARILAP